MKRVYIAGAYSSDNVISVLDNMRIGMRAGVEVLLAGFAPFVPWFDFHFQLMLRGNEQLSVEDYYNYSIAWLDTSDAMLITGNPANLHSGGLQKEMERAEELGIPVFHTLDELKEWDNGKRPR